MRCSWNVNLYLRAHQADSQTDRQPAKVPWGLARLIRQEWIGLFCFLRRYNNFNKSTSSRRNKKSSFARCGSKAQTLAGRRVTTGSVSPACSLMMLPRQAEKQKNKNKKQNQNTLLAFRASNECQPNALPLPVTRAQHNSKTFFTSNIMTKRHTSARTLPLAEQRGCWESLGRRLVAQRCSSHDWAWLRETKTSGWTAPVYLVYFTADTAANKCVSCNTVHLEN